MWSLTFKDDVCFHPKQASDEVRLGLGGALPEMAACDCILWLFRLKCAYLCSLNMKDYYIEHMSRLLSKWKVISIQTWIILHNNTFKIYLNDIAVYYRVHKSNLPFMSSQMGLLVSWQNNVCYKEVKAPFLFWARQRFHCLNVVDVFY